MGDLHDRAVEELYETLDFLINDYDREVFWDEVYTEQDYFEGQIDPRDVPDYEDRGKQVGEIDVLLVREKEAPEKNWMKYIEVKPERTGTSYAEDQMSRAEDFFEPRGWNVLTEAYTVPEWGSNWYDKQREVSIDDLEESEEVSDHKYSAEIDEVGIDAYISDVEEDFIDRY
jgi:GNAT superfamily N-acetyltransferase